MQTSFELAEDGAYPVPPQRDACDVFVKLGGSILNHELTTAALVPTLIALAREHRVLVMAGGGQVAKRIKANQRLNDTDFFMTWRAGVLCLEVNAHLLASYSKQLAVVSSFWQASACYSAGQVAVFAPAGAILNSFHLPPDWQATTDSIGLYFANITGARRYVIVSDVDGIYERNPEGRAPGTPIPRMNVADVERLGASKLDAAFPLYFRLYGLPTVVVNGKYPERVMAAVRGAPTIGTAIEVSAAGAQG
jgi:5-(aminomethyl)-3-furanmethanol phosphate kinase